MAGNSTGSLSASAPTPHGWLYYAGDFTPYDLENLYDQISTLGRGEGGDVHVEIDLGGLPRNSPEVQVLEQRMKRLRLSGVTVRLHAVRRRARRSAQRVDTPAGNR